MSRQRLLPLFVLLASVPAAFAASFVVPTDSQLLLKSDGVIRGTVGASRSRLTANGTIETVLEVTVDEVVKGASLFPGPMEIVQLGGVLGDVALVIDAAPKYVEGEEVLIFLTRRDNGEWTTTDFVVGKFGRRGKQYVRDAELVVGNTTSGDRHVERPRDAEKFLTFLRESVTGGAPRNDYFSTERTISGQALRIAATAAGDYASRATFSGVTRPYRWNGFGAGINFVRGNNHPSYPNQGADAIIAGAAAWTNDCGSNVVYNYVGFDGTANKGFTVPDGKHSVIFEDPNNEIPNAWNPAVGGTLAIGGTFIFDTTHTGPGGEIFYTSSEAKVIFQDNVSAATGINITTFNEVMTHELGHTLAFRHSNESGRTPMSNSAIMNSTASGSFGTTLQQYDIDAVRAMYPTACVAVTAPTGVIATAATNTAISVAWNAVAGASSYRIFRSTSGLTFTQVGSTSGTNFLDSTSAGTAYLYKVRAVDASSNESADSNIDLATSIVFTDTLTPGVTGIRSVHLTEIQTAVSAVKVLAGQGTFTFSQAPTVGSLIRASQVTEARSALNSARTALGLPALAFTDPGITVGTSIAKAVHATELRAGMQ